MSRIKGRSAASNVPSDPRYIASLKEQIEYLELECQVLKKRNGECQEKRFELSRDSNCSVHLGTSLAELNEAYRVLEEEHRSEIQRRDAHTLTLEKELHTAKAKAADVQRKVDLIQARADDFIESQSFEMEKKCAHLCEQLQSLQNAEERATFLEIKMKNFEESTLHDRSVWKAEEAFMREEHTKMKSELEFTKQRLQDMEVSHGADRKRLEDLETLSRTFEEDKENLLQKANAAKICEDQMRQELAYTRASLAKSQDLEQATQLENKQLIESNAALHEQLRQCHQKLTEMASSEDQARKQCDEALAKAQTQQVKMDTMLSKISHFEQHLEQEIERHTDDTTTIAKERAKVFELEKRLESCKSELAYTSKKLNKTEQHASQLLAETASLKSKLQYQRKQLNLSQEELNVARQAQAWAEKQCQKLSENAEMSSELKNLNLGELRNVMETNLHLAAQFDKFLKKHQQNENDSSIMNVHSLQ